MPSALITTSPIYAVFEPAEGIALEPPGLWPVALSRPIASDERTIENLIVVNSTYGISLTAVSNALLTNDTLIGSHSVNEYFVSVEFGTNVTVENSNFQFNHTATDSYGVYAYSDVLLNVSSNNFSGATSDYFIYIYTVSSFSAWNNRVMSTDQSSYGIAIEDGASAVLGYNYFNYTDTGIYVYYQQSVTSLYNHVGNSTYGTLLTVNSFGCDV